MNTDCNTLIFRRQERKDAYSKGKKLYIIKLLQEFLYRLFQRCSSISETAVTAEKGSSCCTRRHAGEKIGFFIINS